MNIILRVINFIRGIIDKLKGRKEMDVQGNLNVSRNMTVGGDVSTGGSFRVGRNLKVEGWLEAKNIKGPLKGLFGTAESLKESYPEPEPGWFALVGDGLPAQVYRSEYGEWKATGETSGELQIWVEHSEQEATEEEPGLMSAEDKRKLDSIKGCNLTGVLDLAEMEAYLGEEAPGHIGVIEKLLNGETKGEVAYRYLVADNAHGGRIVGTADFMVSGEDEDLRVIEVFTSALSYSFTEGIFEEATNPGLIHTYLKVWEYSIGDEDSFGYGEMKWRGKWKRVNEVASIGLRELQALDDANDYEKNTIIRVKEGTKDYGFVVFSDIEANGNAATMDIFFTNLKIAGEKINDSDEPGDKMNIYFRLHTAQKEVMYPHGRWEDFLHLNAATSTDSGLMSAEDKQKFDCIGKPLTLLWGNDLPTEGEEMRLVTNPGHIETKSELYDMLYKGQVPSEVSVTLQYGNGAYRLINCYSSRGSDSSARLVCLALDNNDIIRLSFKSTRDSFVLEKKEKLNL